MVNLSSDAKAVAHNVNEAIRAAGENPHKIAQATGLPLTTLKRNLLGNEPGFPVGHLYLIATHLGTTPSSFYRPIESAAN